MRDKKKEYLYTKLKEERIFQGKVYFDFHFRQRYANDSLILRQRFHFQMSVYLFGASFEV